MDGSVLEGNDLLRCLDCILLKLDWSSYIASIAETTFKKIGALICSMKLLFIISINLPCSLAWNTVVMPELVLLAATWMY